MTVEVCPENWPRWRPVPASQIRTNCVGAARNEGATIRAEGQGEDLRVGTWQGGVQFAGLDVPELDRPVAGRGNSPAVRAEHDPLHRAVMGILEQAQQPSIRGVPDPHLLARRTRDDRPAVGAERDAQAAGGAHVEMDEQSSGLGIPDSQGRIGARAREAFAVGAEVQAGHTRLRGVHRCPPAVAGA